MVKFKHSTCFEQKAKLHVTVFPFRV